MSRGTRIAFHVLVWTIATAVGLCMGFGAWLVLGAYDFTADIGAAMGQTGRAIDPERPTALGVGACYSIVIGLVGSLVVEAFARHEGASGQRPRTVTDAWRHNSNTEH